jgi:hypothetical protein
MSFTYQGSGPVSLNLIDLWNEYCDKRGLTPEMIKSMDPNDQGGLMILERANKLFPGISGLRSVGAIGAFVFPIAEGEYRARVLYDPNFQIDPKPAKADSQKQQKYRGQQNSISRVYIPTLVSNWYDSKYNLLIVEGAFNAVRLCADGFHAVAISGVYNWRDKTAPKGDDKIIDDLAALLLSDHIERVTVLFDSDSVDEGKNVQLIAAKHRLCQAITKLLSDRKQTIYTCAPTPRKGGAKRGPDDYLQEEGLEKFQELLDKGSRLYEDFPRQRIERESIERYIYVKKLEKFFDTLTWDEISTTQLDKELMGRGKVYDYTANKSKPDFYTHKDLLATHALDGLRFAYDIKFRPDLKDVYYQDEKDGNKYINCFNPKHLPTPLQGDVSLFYESLRSLCRNSPSAVDKIMVILARHVQSPGLTPKYGILFTGKPRAGKSNMAKLIGLALGGVEYSHFTKINLKTEFNGDYKNKVAKEWPEFDKNMDSDWLKDLITSDTRRVNNKHGRIEDVANFMLNMFTCNGLQSQIEEDDGRFVICGYAEPDNKDLGLAFEEWVKASGPNHLRHHLLYDIDASSYDRLDVKTEMRDAVIKASKSNIGQICDQVIADLEEVQGLECTTAELLSEILRPYDVNPIHFIRQNSTKFWQTHREQIKIDGKTYRFRAFKNTDFWRKCDDATAYRQQLDLIINHMKATNSNRKY